MVLFVGWPDLTLTAIDEFLGDQESSARAGRCNAVCPRPEEHERACTEFRRGK
jgi:hypothetical protein